MTVTEHARAIDLEAICQRASNVAAPHMMDLQSQTVLALVAAVKAARAMVEASDTIVHHATVAAEIKFNEADKALRLAIQPFTVTK